jgi:hypothetical protein
MVIYTDLSATQFEELVIEFCVDLLGYGVQGFVTGMDGGRDARFCGRAQLVPSTSDPWDGTIVIQAKHTELLNKSFSEADFSGDGDDSILAKEVERVKALFERGELDYYMLFSNRRCTGVAEADVRKYIASSTGLPEDKIRLYDESELDRLIKRFPKAVDRACLNPGKSPPQIDPTNLAEIITRMANYKGQLDELMEGEKRPPAHRTSPEEKNKLNGLREEYFKRTIRGYMVDFGVIREFLGHPDSQPYVSLYDDISEELQAKLVAWSDPSIPYERLLEQLVATLFKLDFDLRVNKRLTRTLVFYMYCNCDIGGDDDPAQ